MGLRLVAGAADHLQCPVDALNLAQGLRAAVAIRVPARGQTAPRRLHLGIAAARSQAKFAVRVVEFHDLLRRSMVAAVASQRAIHSKNIAKSTSGAHQASASSYGF
ncbi:hypothetical protein MASR1M50_16490 [Burkholderiales bacterium]